jgi:general secretion pathway protein N
MRDIIHRPRLLVLLIVAMLALLIATFPLRLAFSWLGLADQGVSARSVRGPVWWGGVEELEVAGVRLGTVDAWLSPWPLLTGRARLDIRRVRGLTDDIRGAVSLSPGSRGVDDVTGTVPLGARMAPLPVTALDFTDFSVRFTGNLCTGAQGRVRARLPAIAAVAGLANGLSGAARCEGSALLLPLASQSGQEKLELRITADGRYTAVMRVTPADAVVGAALRAYGFSGDGGSLILRYAGTL